VAPRSRRPLRCRSEGSEPCTSFKRGAAFVAQMCQRDHWTLTVHVPRNAAKKLNGRKAKLIEQQFAICQSQRPLGGCILRQSPECLPECWMKSICIVLLKLIGKTDLRSATWREQSDLRFTMNEPSFPSTRFAIFLCRHHEIVVQRQHLAGHVPSGLPAC
jgi:hypothetical protein